MKVLKFDPLYPDCEWISKRQNQAIRARKVDKQLLVIMCAGCNSIVHQSQARSFRNNDFQIKELRNVKTALHRDRILFNCNKCSKEIGEFQNNTPAFKIKSQNVIASRFSWNEHNRFDKFERELPISCLSGLKIKRMEELVQELIYLKCLRYQMKMCQLNAKIKYFHGAFIKFIQLVNLFKSEEQMFLNKKREQTSMQELNTASNQNEFQAGSKKVTLKRLSNLQDSHSNKLALSDCELTPSTYMNTISGRRSLELSKLTIIKEAKQRE